MIKINNLSVAYDKTLPLIIKNLSLTLEKGCILNILGQNAIGKTTLIKTLMRELRSYNGSIRVKGVDILEYSIKDYSKIVGVVSTSFNTFQNLLVADYLITGFVNQMSPFNSPNNVYVEKAYNTLKSFGKEELFNKQIDQLSSGEKQIVMIARVLLQDPEIIIVDEPTANLDVKNQIAVLNQIKKLSEQGYTILVTTHNPGHAYSMGGKTLMMGKGKYAFGETEQIITEENLSDFYELNVSIKNIQDFRCMVFGNSDDEIKIVL